MKITKYVTPVSQLDTVFDRLGFGLPSIDRLFGDANLESPQGWAAVRLPRTNVHETEQSFVFTMEMPGLSKEHIEVNIEGDILTIKGAKSEGSPEQSEAKGVLRREFRATRFERTFNIGDAVDRENVKAKMEDGILTVTLPKSAEKVGRKVDVA